MVMISLHSSRTLTKTDDMYNPPLLILPENLYTYAHHTVILKNIKVFYLPGVCCTEFKIKKLGLAAIQLLCFF